MIILPANTLSTGGYEVANSCRFNDGDSPYLSRTFGGAGDLDKWTFSCWYKRSAISSGTQRLFGAGSNNTTIYFTSTDKLAFYDAALDTGWDVQDTNHSKFRDPSAFIHIVWTLDSAQAVAANRVKCYINGTQQTLTKSGSGGDQHFTTAITTAAAHFIGKRPTHSTGYLDGYLAEVCFCDGQAYAASDFGEYDEDSPQIWKPKDVSGLTFGTNGFYLDFEDSSNLGNDANGGTDWTATNLAATDQSISTPTNIFASGNFLLKRGSSTVSEGNLKIQDSAGAWQGLSTTIGASAGKWYCEWKVTAVNSNSFGVVGEDSYSISNDGTAIGFTTPSVSILQNGDRYIDNSGASYSGSFTTNDIIGCAMDLDNHKVYFSKGGEWSNGSGSWDSSTFNSSVGAISLSQTSGFYFFGHSVHTATSEANYGDPPYTISSGNADANGYGNFEYAVPSGYLSLCTKNLGSDGG